MNRFLYLLFFIALNSYSVFSQSMVTDSQSVPQDPAVVNELIFGTTTKKVDAQQEKQQLIIMKKKAAAKKRAQSEKEDMMIIEIEKQFIKKILDSIKRILLRNMGFIVKVIVLNLIIICSSMVYNYYKWQNFQTIGLLR
jgi:hypothetical protein